MVLPTLFPALHHGPATTFVLEALFSDVQALLLLSQSHAIALNSFVIEKVRFMYSLICSSS